MRDRRRCAACGVVLPADAARCPTCGHVEGEPIVAVADGQGPATEGPRGRRPVLIAVLVVLGIVAVLAVVDQRTRTTGDEDSARAEGEETTTTRRATSTSRRSNTPTTPPDRSFEPPILFAPGLRLFGWTAPGWGEILDPATGTITSTRLASGSEFISVVPRLGGAVVVNGSSASAGWFAELPTSDEPTRLSDGVFEAFPSDVPSRVWVVRSLDTTTVLEIDLETGDIVDELELPATVNAVGSIDDGVILRAPGGLYAYQRGEDRYEQIAAGEYVASAGRWVAYQSCDDRLICPIFVRDLVDGTTVEMASPPDNWVMEGAMSSDGRWLAAVVQEPIQGWRIVAYERATGRSMPVSTGTSGASPFVQVAWTPDGEWLLWPESPGIRLFHPADNTVTSIDNDGSAYQGVAVLEGPTPDGG